MITDVLHCIANQRQSLSREEARSVMSEILSGKCTDAQIAALLVALHMKGETVEEIVGFAEAIRAAAVPLELSRNSTLDVSGTGRDALVDTCGTGGDTSGTFNISTATALVVAGAGVRVAKHGNRSVTSKCGSADVMEALGVNINLPPARLEACLEEVGIAFLFAPAMHSAMKYVHAAIIRSVLDGAKSAQRDVVLLNAAAALVAASRADHLADAVPIAAKAIDSGAAAEKLNSLVKFTNAHH